MSNPPARTIIPNNINLLMNLHFIIRANEDAGNLSPVTFVRLSFVFEDIITSKLNCFSHIYSHIY